MSYLLMPGNKSAENIDNNCIECEDIYELIETENIDNNRIECEDIHELLETESIDNNRIECEDIHELLEITTDSKLTLENVNKLCKRASQKLKTLAWISIYIVLDKRKIIMKALITL